MAYEGMIAETVRVLGHENEVIDAYTARPLGPGPFPGVLVVHHMPGWDEWTREVVRKHGELFRKLRVETSELNRLVRQRSDSFKR